MHIGKVGAWADRDIGVSANNVGELRKATARPENLVISSPQECGPEGAVKVSKVRVATRVSPKL